MSYGVFDVVTVEVKHSEIQKMNLSRNTDYDRIIKLGLSFLSQLKEHTGYRYYASTYEIPDMEEKAGPKLEITPSSMMQIRSLKKRYRIVNIIFIGKKRKKITVHLRSKLNKSES